MQLITTIQQMESNHPVGPGAITEFDQMFKLGCRAIIRAVVASAESWSGPHTVEAIAAPTGVSAASISTGNENELITFLEQATEALLRAWLAHSRGVRLSVLEAVNENNRSAWRDLKRFIEQYGGDLFTQRFAEPRQPPRNPPPGRRCLAELAGRRPR